MPDKQKSINLNNSDALLKVLVVFVSHMYSLTKFYCSASFARQYRNKNQLFQGDAGKILICHQKCEKFTNGPANESFCITMYLIL